MIKLTRCRQRWPNWPARLIDLTRVLVLIGLALGLGACRRGETEPVGIWTGTVINPSGENVAFTLEVTVEGESRYGVTLQNGDERTPSTGGGSWDGRTLRVPFDYYDGELTLLIEGDQLRGEYRRQWQKQELRRELRGKRGIPPPVPAPGGASISGEWVLTVGVAPNQRYWRAAFSQDGSVLKGTLIPVSGDWGSFTGTFNGQELVLNRFDGVNSRLLRGRLRPDGRLEGIVDLGLPDPVSPVRPIIGERLGAGNANNVANLPDPDNYTRVSDPARPFSFSFPDLNGNIVSSTDERFRNRVIIISVTGSWCPNCHEEAPLLEQYYQEYRAQGLEVVALAFEYTGELTRDQEQLRIFAARHRLTFPLLLAGTTEEGDAQRKLPQLVNFGAYPTTIFVGKDGLVRRIHTGFEGRATGERHLRLKAEYRSLIEQMLTE
ncbi:MAG: TlpA family protein disulfide reductase [Acidobacteria bacterium]|nr:TlpA family protein disulfide reductase [Acidobacteriota bacterium]